MKPINSVLASMLVLSCLLVGCSTAPKRMLVVTVTKGFRHSSIPTAEKVLGELSSKSRVFKVDYVRNDEDMAQKMTPAALKSYDGVIFANTTGDLPLPDKQAFLDWLKSGKAFVGMHSATDTFRGHTPLDPYVDMIGGEFRHHDAQAEVDCIVQDAKHPACTHLPNPWHVKDEIYLLNGFDPGKVHRLLSLDKNPKDKAPGDFPIAWTRQYGKGRVFYTSLGHREDVWDPNTPADFKRENSTEVSERYQKHILAGIEWALGRR